MSLRDWELDIIAQLHTVLDASQVFEESVPETDQLPRFDTTMAKPYVVLWWGQRVDGGIGHNSLCGVLHSSHKALFLIQLVAPTGPMGRDLAALVSDALLGYRPAGQGELTEDSMPTIRNPLDISGAANRIRVPLAFSGTVDL